MTAPKLVDLVKITVLTGGTGVIGLGAAAVAYRGVDALTDGETYPYSIQQGAEYEIGTGVYLAAGNNFSRTPEWSSNGNAPINVLIGSAVSFVARAEDFYAYVGAADILQALLESPAGSSYVNFIQGGTGAIIRTVQDKLREATPTVRDRGAPIDGTTNAAGYFLTADGNGPFVVPAGAYLIGASITLQNAMHIAPGAVLNIPNGVTLTINGELNADKSQQIFNCTGTGKVVLNRQTTPVSYVEWWGAKGDGSTVDTAPIVAAIAAHGNIQLLAKTYVVGPNAVKLNTNYRHITGMGEFWNGDGVGTRILCNSSHGVIVQVGGDSFPGTINAMPFGCSLMNVYVTRNQAPTNNTDCVAIAVQFGVHMRVEHCGTNETIIGYHIEGVVDTHLAANYAKRDTPVPSGADRYIGFYSDGSASIGAAGSNASLWANDERNRVELTTPISDSYGLLADRGFTDQWWKLETAGPIGIGIGVSGTTGNVNNTDFKIEDSVIDQTTVAAFSITNVNANGSLEINSCYCGPSSGQAMVITNSSTVRVEGGQWRCAATSAVAVSLDNCDQIEFVGVSIDDAGGGGAANIVEIVDCTNMLVSPLIKNLDVSTSGAAINLTGTNLRVKCEPSFYAAVANVLGTGIKVNGITTTKSEFNVTRLDGRWISGGVLLEVNGTAITAAGTDAQGNVFNGAF